jgi:hypothetical protein
MLSGKNAIGGQGSVRTMRFYRTDWKEQYRRTTSCRQIANLI